jgi:uncharacterized membrane-anchored protein
VESFAQTAEASETHFCVPPLRNRALIRERIASEFTKSPEGMQYRQRWHSLLAGVGVMVLAFIVLIVTMLLAPEFVDVVLPVVSTIVGAVVGFLFGGRQPAQSSSPPT